MALRSVGKFVAKSLAMRPRVASPSPSPSPSPSTSTGPLANGELDLSALGATLLRKKWKILRPTILVALVTLLAVEVVTPKYMSESRIFIEDGSNVYLRPDADRDMTDRGAVDQEAVTSQAQIILSQDLAREVIDKLKLGDRPEFDPTLSGVSPIKAVLGLLGLTRDPLSMTPQERVLEAYYDRLTVTPFANSRVINIDFLSQDPELAAKVANAIADGYLVRQRQAKQEQAKSAGQWLAGQIDTMRQKVEDAEAKVENFRAKANLLVGNNNTTLSAQELGDVNAQLAAARAQKADAEAKAKLIRDMLRSGEPIDSSDILNSELIRRLAEQRVTLKAQLAEQSSTLLDNHPRIKELKAQIADLEQQIRAEAATIARSFENDAKLAGARVDSQTAVLDQLKSQAAGTNEQDVQLRALERDAKSQRDLLESYLAKYREATSRDTIDSTPADARVISRATVSSIPAYPKKLPTVLIATFATLVLTSGLIMTREILAAPVGGGPVRTGEAAFAADGLEPRVAAVLGREPLAASPMSIATIASNLRRAGAAAAQLAVFGAAPGLSTSQTAIRLARALAEDSRVVLVGLASGDTAIRGISNEPSAAGLAELARGTATFGAIITKDKLSPLHLISAGLSPLDRIEVLSAPGMVMNFNALVQSYDHVIVDAGPVAGPEIERIAEIAPHAVLVTDLIANSATATARERLLVSGFGDVRIVSGAQSGAADTAAAA
jgi:succinoglycan biosynthesis transport protein ExoP